MPDIKPILKPAGIIAITALLGFLSLFFSGFLSSFSANIVSTDDTIFFDPLITLTYLILFYFLNHFYAFTNKQRGYYFILTLLLSYTINFVEGSIFLLILFPVLKKFKLIETV